MERIVRERRSRERKEKGRGREDTQHGAGAEKVG